MKYDNKKKKFLRESLGRAIRDAREKEGLSIVAAAKLIGVSRLTLANAENGRTNTPYIMAKLICLSFGIKFGCTLTNSDEELKNFFRFSAEGWKVSNRGKSIHAAIGNGHSLHEACTKNKTRWLTVLTLCDCLDLEFEIWNEL